MEEVKNIFEKAIEKVGANTIKSHAIKTIYKGNIYRYDMKTKEIIKIK